LLHVIILGCYILIAFYCIMSIYLLSGFWIRPGLFYRTGNPAGADFIQIWAASSLALQGHPTWIYNPETLKAIETTFLGGSFKGYMSCHLAPSFLVTILPLSCMPYLFALFAWLSIPLFGLMVILRKIAPYPITLLLALAFPAVSLNLYYGQGAFLLTFLLGSGLLFLDSHPITSGILFSLTLNFKPHLGLLIVVALLAGRRWKCFSAIVVSTLTFIIASTLVMGVDTWIAYFKNINYAISILKNESGIWDRMPTIFALIRLQGGSSVLAMVFQTIMAVAIIILLFLVWHCEYPLPVRGSVLVLGIFLCSPYAFEYDLTLLLLPLAWFAVENFQNNWLTGNGVLFAVLWYSPFLDKMMIRTVNVHIEPLIIVIFMFAIIKSAVQFGVKPGSNGLKSENNLILND